MTRRKSVPRSQSEMLKAMPGECGPRELATILGRSLGAPKQWRDLGMGPAYREEDGRIIYDARSVATWLHHNNHGQEIFKRVPWLAVRNTD